eukprot:gene2141-2460_t
MHTLRVKAIVQLAPAEEGLSLRLVRPGDTLNYCEKFLNKTIVCFCSQPPPQQQPWRLSQRYTQEQVVLQAIDTLVASNASNVLRAGYKKRNPGTRFQRAGQDGASSSFIPGLYHAQQQQANTSTALLLGAEWQQLLSRIGDELMLLLLLHSSIFVMLPGSNYLQVTGKPLHEVSCP